MKLRSSQVLKAINEVENISQQNPVKALMIRSGMAVFWLIAWLQDVPQLTSHLLTG